MKINCSRNFKNCQQATQKKVPTQHKTEIIEINLQVAYLSGRNVGVCIAKLDLSRNNQIAIFYFGVVQPNNMNTVKR